MTDTRFTLSDLDAIVRTRAASGDPGSYTRKLMDKGVSKIAQKVGEEAVEAAIAAVRQEAEAKLAAALVEIQAAAQVAAKELQPISSTLADDISNQVLSEARMA